MMVYVPRTTAVVNGCNAAAYAVAVALLMLLLASPGAAGTPYHQKTCERMRRTWNIDHQDTSSDHPIVLVVGEGTCATHWVGQAVADTIQKYVFHWRETIFPRWGGAKKLFGTPEYKEHKSQYASAFQHFMRMQPNARDAHNFRMLDGIPAVADEPIPQYFPYLFRAYPKAKIILSIRNASNWVRSRSTKKSRSPMPLAGFMSLPIQYIEGLNTNQHMDKPGFAPVYPEYHPRLNHEAGSELMFHLHNMLVQCIVPPEQLLTVNVAGDGETATQLKIKTFLAGHTP